MRGDNSKQIWVYPSAFMAKWKLKSDKLILGPIRTNNDIDVDYKGLLLQIYIMAFWVMHK